MDQIRHTFKNRENGDQVVATCFELNQVYEADFQNKIIELDHKVYDTLKDKSIYVPMAEWELAYLKCINAKFYGIEVEGELLAYYAFWQNDYQATIPPELQKAVLEAKIYNLADDLPFIPLAEKIKTIEIHRALYHNKLQNYGINQYFLPKIFEQIGKLGYLHLTATISPYNCPSFISAIKSGLTVAQLKTKYGDKMRYIMYKNLQKDLSYGAEKILVDHLDIDGQKSWLAKGYRGIAVNKGKNQQGETQISLVYALPLRD